MTSKRFLLVTGATGFLGSEFVRRQLRWDPESSVCLLVRDKRRAEVQLSEWLPAKSVELIEADFQKPDLGLGTANYDRLVSAVTDIFHFAADVRFHLSIEDARAANVVPTLQLLNFAEEAYRKNRFKHFHQISTYAIARADDDGMAREVPVARKTVFRNTYEQTKAEAEQLVLDRSWVFPVSIYRTSIVGGDSKTGWTYRFNSLYQVIRLFMSEVAVRTAEVPVAKGSRIDSVPVDFVTDSIYWLGLKASELSPSRSGSIYHVTAGRKAPAVAELLNRGFKILIDEYASRGISSIKAPEIKEVSGMESGVNALMSAMAQSCGGKKTLLRMFEKYSPYFSDPVIYDNSRFIEALKSTQIRPCSIADCLQPMLKYCVETNWGDAPWERPMLALRPGDQNDV